MPSAPTLPIALTSLKIKDFRGIKELEFDFLGPDGLPNNLIVLAGPNGCGKTAVLEAALLAIGGHRRVMGHGDRRSIRAGAADYAIEATVLTGDGSRTFRESSRNQLPEEKPRVPFWYFAAWRDPKLIGGVDVTVRKSGRRPKKTDSDRLADIKRRLTNIAAMENFPGANLRPSRKRYSEFIPLVNTEWKRFYPEHNDTFYVGLVDVAEGEDDGAFDIYWKRDNLQSVPIDLLSSGQMELFIFLTALVLNDDQEGLVFIDEPELHLDPQWHAPIVRVLARLQPKAQFIVSTHSPEIYDAAMSYERHFLVPDDDPRARAWQPRVGTGSEL